MEKVVFVCCKYKPAHKYLIDSYFHILHNNGMQMLFLSDFSNYPSGALPSCCKFTSLSDFEKETNPSIFIIVSPSKSNISIVKAIKRNNKCNKVIYIFHEPVSFSILIADHGFKLRTLLYGLGLNYFNGPKLINRCDYIILPSNKALQLYEKNKKFKVKHSQLNLMFLQQKKGAEVLERHYFSYIGTVATNHGFDSYVEFLLSDFCPSSQKVMLATNSSVDRMLLNKLRDKFGKNAKLFTGQFISEEEMRICYKETLALWLGYANSTQSGILPMAYMFGTPILFSPIDSFKEFAENFITGYEIKPGDFVSISRGLGFIKNNVEMLSLNCVSRYNRFFNPENKEKELLDVLSCLSD